MAVVISSKHRLSSCLWLFTVSVDQHQPTIPCLLACYFTKHPLNAPPKITNNNNSIGDNWLAAVLVVAVKKRSRRNRVGYVIR